MNKLLLTVFLILPVTFFSATLLASDTKIVVTERDAVKTVSSPDNRVAVLELYTSEGCSSCPPADRFLSGLKAAGISEKQLIPMAFHVTYWDYIGWEDRFAEKQFDVRQRNLANKNKRATVYTPQFVLSGDDYRRYANFSEDVNKLVRQKSSVDLTLSVRIQESVATGEMLHLSVMSDVSDNEPGDIDYYLVVLESNLVSDVNDGENDGEKLHHDYVVRRLLGPYVQRTDEIRLDRKQGITLPAKWKKQDLSIVAFAENSRTGEVLQAVRLDYK